MKIRLNEPMEWEGKSVDLVDYFKIQTGNPQIFFCNFYFNDELVAENIKLEELPDGELIQEGEPVDDMDINEL